MLDRPSILMSERFHLFPVSHGLHKFINVQQIFFLHFFEPWIQCAIYSLSPTADFSDRLADIISHWFTRYL